MIFRGRRSKIVDQWRSGDGFPPIPRPNKQKKSHEIGVSSSRIVKNNLKNQWFALMFEKTSKNITKWIDVRVLWRLASRAATTEGGRETGRRSR
ncbi:MAG: hypothetical protein QE267_00985, partial [Akkermansiaceae bacterium]|nr:hypothetical protein [Akkermansiaceae bacterium]